MKKKKVVNLEDAKLALKLLVRCRVDFQGIRKSMDNRLGRKATGERQDIPNRHMLSGEYQDIFLAVSQAAKNQEHEIEKYMKKLLKLFPVYVKYLSKVKGVGHIASGWIISEFDIQKATTVSKMWQFSGMNPGLVRGKKRHEQEDGSFLIEITNTMIRGDRLTPGFVSPFNQRLRTALLGVMASGFIKAQNDYAMNHYYPYKERLANSDVEVEEIQKGGKKKMCKWRDAKPSHRDRAAQRHMIKKFLQDLYVAWRGIEGLPVREPYAEEYLGKIHQEETSHSEVDNHTMRASRQP